MRPVIFNCKNQGNNSNQAIKKILIANRGEVVWRIVQTCQLLKIETVVLYTSSEADYPHARCGDQQVCLGAGDLAATYLNGEKIIAIALATQADAIHPGYGMLAENAHFARQVWAAGLIFIGPRPQTIALMGDKRAAKDLVAALNIPVIAGASGINDDGELYRQAEGIGTPLLIKACAGGGGKGIKLVENLAHFGALLQSARSEAQNFFANGEILLEKYLPHARHLEVQIVGDHHGNLCHLFERDCSLQRRYQKVIEETFAPNLSEQCRQRLYQAAIKIAQAINYHSLGTVEFLLDAQENFYFLEMNTRLQVEHSITELLCGQDLVAWQIAIAQDQCLPLTQSEIQGSGHAIEARIYAEDPANNFLPVSGAVELIGESSKYHGVRVENCYGANNQLSLNFDPLISKISVWAPTRQQAIAKMQLVLQECAPLGIASNLSLLRQLLVSRDFVLGGVSTQFLAGFSFFPPSTAGSSTDTISNSNSNSKQEQAWALGALLWAQKSSAGQNQNIWQQLPSFRHTGPVAAKWWLNQQEIHCYYQWRGKEEQELELELAGEKFQLHFPPRGGPAQVRIARVGERYHLLTPTQEYWATAQSLTATSGHSPSQGRGHWQEQLQAPMPGKIVSIEPLVADGMVEQGTVLLVMEAMKMEHIIAAPLCGRVEKFNVTCGEQVAMGQLLLDFIPQ